VNFLKVLPVNRISRTMKRGRPDRSHTGCNVSAIAKITSISIGFVALLMERHDGRPLKTTLMAGGPN